MKYIDEFDIDKVYGIIQFLPIEKQRKIIYLWVASIGDKSQTIYEMCDNDEEIRVWVDLVKEILTHDVEYYDIDQERILERQQIEREMK